MGFANVEKTLKHPRDKELRYRLVLVKSGKSLKFELRNFVLKNNDVCHEHPRLPKNIKDS